MSFPQSDPNKPPHHWQRKHIIIIAIVVVIALWGMGSRILAARELRNNTEEQAIPIVNIIKAPQGPADEEVVLPGTVEAWHQAPIYARTNGYVKDWKTGMGTRVKTGDLLAEIDTPEVDSQLAQAKADLATADANNQLAQTTANRWKLLLKTDAVSRQDADEKIGDALAKAAALKAAQANVDRLNDLESFKRVVAPFDGTITSRTTDIGALITSGSTTGQILFRIAQMDKLRIYVQVPQNYIAAITPEMPAEIHFPEHPDKSYPAKLYHTADAIEPVSRTQLIEFVLENEKGELLPGGYVDVHLKFPSAKNVIRLPVNTLIFRSEGMQVATVDENGKVVLKSVQIGRDFGNQVEIVGGISPGDPVILNPPDSIIGGQQVKIVTPDESKDSKPADAKDSKKDDKKDDRKP